MQRLPTTSDNIHARQIIIGIVNLLNNNVIIEYIDNGIEKTNHIPFFYSATGDERFLQDYFVTWSQCLPKDYILGSFDKKPRGIINVASANINTGNMTNRFERGVYTKEINGQIETFSSNINSIPMDYMFDVEIETDTHLDLFKIQQSILELFYKTQVYSVYFKGFRVPCQAGFPEDYNIEKTFEFTYPDSNKNSLKFQIAIESYYPIIDKQNERLITNTMDSIVLNNSNIGIQNEIAPKSVKKFKWINTINGDLYYSGTTVDLKWNTLLPIPKINLYWSTDLHIWNPIARNIQNKDTFAWNIPFFNSGNIINTDPINIEVQSERGVGAKLRAIIGNNSQLEKVIFLEPGRGYRITDPLIIEPINIEDNMIFPKALVCLDMSNGINHANIETRGSNLPISQITEIYLKIEDSQNLNNYEIANWSPQFTGDINRNVITNINAQYRIDFNLNEQIIGDLPINTVITNWENDQNRLEINNIANINSSNQEFQLLEREIKIKIQ